MHYPTIIQCLTVIDTKKTIEFYKKAFGFTHTNPSEDYAEMRFKDIVIMFGNENQFPGDTRLAPKTSGTPCPVTLYVYCDDVHAFYEHAIKNGAKGVTEPSEMPWGDIMCNIEDIDGYSWSFSQRSSHSHDDDDNSCCSGH
jgi:uncharacterized glyoxalase superfamily protein PhnB